MTIDGIEVDTDFTGERIYGVDIRVYRWLEQWFSKDEARAFVYSLSANRLIRLVFFAATRLNLCQCGCYDQPTATA